MSRTDEVFHTRNVEAICRLAFNFKCDVKCDNKTYSALEVEGKSPIRSYKVEIIYSVKVL